MHLYSTHGATYCHYCLFNYIELFILMCLHLYICTLHTHTKHQHSHPGLYVLHQPHFYKTDFVSKYLRNQWRQTLPKSTYWKDQSRANTLYTGRQPMQLYTLTTARQTIPKQRATDHIHSQTHLTHVTQQCIMYSFLPLRIRHSSSVDAVQICSPMKHK